MPSSGTSTSPMPSAARTPTGRRRRCSRSSRRPMRRWAASGPMSPDTRGTESPAIGSGRAGWLTRARSRGSTHAGPATWARSGGPSEQTDETVEDQAEAEADESEQRLAERPGLQRRLRVHTEEARDQPESRIVDVTGEDRTGGQREHDGDDLQAREVRIADDDRLDQRGRGGQRHGRRTLGDAHDGGDDEPGDDDRQTQGSKRIGERIADAAGPQNASEHAAGPGDEDDRADRSQGGVDDVLDHRPTLLLPPAEQPHGDDDGDEQRDRGLAQQPQGRDGNRFGIDPAGLSGEVEAGVGEDEHERQDEEEDDLGQLRAGGELGELVALAPGEDIGYGDLDALSDEETEQVAGEVPGGDGDDETADEHEPDVRTEQPGGGHRTRMRRHEDEHRRARH